MDENFGVPTHPSHKNKDVARAGHPSVFIPVTYA
jgi:hypothetical protein